MGYLPEGLDIEWPDYWEYNFDFVNELAWDFALATLLAFDAWHEYLNFAVGFLSLFAPIF